MVRPIKTTQLPNLQQSIKETAWKQITEYGAPALSLRAIARELKITAPAIYNYFPDRDALVTALIIDAYTSFGDWQLEARDSLSTAKPRKKLEAIGLAYRNWATPIPSVISSFSARRSRAMKLQKSRCFPLLRVRSAHSLALWKSFARQENWAPM